MPWERRGVGLRCSRGQGWVVLYPRAKNNKVGSGGVRPVMAGQCITVGDGRAGATRAGAARSLGGGHPFSVLLHAYLRKYRVLCVRGYPTGFEGRRHRGRACWFHFGQRWCHRDDSLWNAAQVKRVLEYILCCSGSCCTVLTVQARPALLPSLSLPPLPLPLCASSFAITCSFPPLSCRPSSPPLLPPMPSSPTHSEDAVEAREDSIDHEPVPGLPQHTDTHGGDDNGNDHDDKSERNILADYKLVTRSFPPLISLYSHGDATEGSVVSQHSRRSSISLDAQSNTCEHGGSALPEGMVSREPLLKKDWFRVVDYSSKAARLRKEILKVRKKTREARVEKDAADNAFISLLRPLLLSTQNSTSAEDPGAAGLTGRALDYDLDGPRLRALLGGMQEARNRCQAQELSMEAWEDQLDTAYRGLDDAIRLFINHQVGSEPQHFSEETVVEDDSMPDLLLGLDEEPTENYPPLYMEFMTTLGEHGLAVETHEDNLARKADIDDELFRHALRKQYQPGDLSESLEIDAADLKFHAGFEKSEEEALEKMKELEEQADLLRDLCFEKGVVPRYAEISELYYYHPRQFAIDPDPTTETDKDFDERTSMCATSSQFWVLLSKSHHLLRGEPQTVPTALALAEASLEQDPDDEEKIMWRQAMRKEAGIGTLIQNASPGHKGDFVNRWALHKLRTSPMEIEILLACFMHETGIYVTNVLRWQIEVLNCWKTDEAARAPPSQFEGAISKVEAASEGSISDSSLASWDDQSIGCSDHSVSSQTPDDNPRVPTDDQFEAQDEVASEVGNDEVLQLPPSRDLPVPPEEQVDVSTRAQHALPSEELPTLKPEVVAAVLSDASADAESNTSQTLISAQEQSLEPEPVLNSLSDHPHSVEVEGASATPTKTPPEQADEPVMLTEQSDLSCQDASVLSTESNNIEREKSSVDI